MSPRGGRRGHPRRSRYPDQAPLSGVDKAIEQEHCRGIFDALEGLDEVPDPMSVEITMSQLLGQWWAMPTVGDVGPDGLFGNMVVRYAKEQRSPLGLLVLSTLAVIAPLPDVRAAAAAAAKSLIDRGVRQPAAAGIGEVTVGRCWVAADVYGDQADVIAEFSYGDERHALCVLVDHNLGGIAKDAFTIDDVDAALTELQKAAATDDLLASPRQIEPSLGRALLESACAASDLIRGEPVSDDYAKSRALLLARQRSMPEGTQPPTAEEPTPEQQAALVADFFASPEAADLDPETAGHLVRLFVEYGHAREPSPPIRISPLKLEDFLHRWLPRHALLDAGERAALPATVRAVVAWARSRTDLPPAAVRDLDEATEDILGAFAGEYDDPNNLGLARQLLRAVGEPGKRAQRPPRTAKKASPAPAARARSSKRAPAGAYQIKVSLRGAKPPIWRRLMVPASVTLADLHLIIQYAMGWDNYHLHLFDVGGTRYGEPDPELELRDEARVRLRDVAPAERAKIRYEYDFGDGWEHDIVVEKIVDERVEQAVLLAGRRACPPEDCGGIPGYYHLLDVLSDPTNDEFEHLSTWVGGDFAPDELDIDGINDLLGAMILGPQRRRRP